MTLSRLLTTALVLVALVPVVTAEDLRYPGDEQPVSAIVEALSTKRPLALKPVGTSSVVFRMDLEGPIESAWKPRTKLHPQGHLAEVAAFRIGRALGMDNVTPAVPRSLPLEMVRSLLGSNASRWPEISQQVLPDGDTLQGTALYWIPDMHELGLDTKDGVLRWSKWLAQDGELPERDKLKSQAQDLSSMLVFDYLIGNWDRFSGANAQGDHGERRLFVRDHNVAFAEPLPRQLHERVLGRLRKVERFSKSFVSALKALDQAALDRALTEPSDPAGYRALDDARVAAVLDRRRTVLSYIAAMLDRYGEAAVLVFP